MGKPDAIIYKSAMELVGLSQDQVLAIGDSLEHDIKGYLSFFVLYTSYTWSVVNVSATDIMHLRHNAFCRICGLAKNTRV